MNNPSPKAPPQSACFLALMESSKKGNTSIIESLIKTESFSQEQLDDAFRNCIKYYTKKKHDSFKKCLSLFLSKTQDINYQNPKHGNTTLLMHSFEVGQEYPISLLLSSENLDVSVTDSKGENCLFKLLQNRYMDEQSQCVFLKRLVALKIDIGVRNAKGENAMDVVNSGERSVIKKKVSKHFHNAKFSIMKCIEMYNKEQYEELVNLVERFMKREDSETLYSNLKFEYNRLIMQMKISHNENDIRDLLYKVVAFMENDIRIHSHVPHMQILFINKLFMFFHMGRFDQFKETVKLIQLSNNEELLQDKMFYIYMQCVYIDFLYERHLIKEAQCQLSLLHKHFENKLSFLDFQTESTLSVYNDFFAKTQLFNITNDTDFEKLVQLYSIAFMIYENSEKEYIEGNVPLTKPHIKQALNTINQLGIDESNTSSIVYRFFVYLQIHLIYYSSHFSLNKINIKLEQLLNSTVQCSDSSQSEIALIFYYNTNGILNLKNSNYVLASFYFLRCIYIIKHKTSFYLIKLNHYYPQIAFNLALSYFFQKQYAKCISILSYLLSQANSLLAYRKYVYYRLALSQLELHMQLTKPQREKYAMLYQHHIESEIKGSKNNAINVEDVNKCMPFPRSIKDNFEKCLKLINNWKRDPIYVSTVINLVYCCIRNREYSQALFYLNYKLKGCRLTSMQCNVVNAYRLQVRFCMRNVNRSLDVE